MYSKGPQMFIVFLLGIAMTSHAKESPSPEMSNSDSGLKPIGFDGIDERKNRLREGTQQKAHSKTPCSDSLKEGEVEEVKEWFHKIDTNGDSVIDIKELGAAMSFFGQKLTEDELRDMMDHYDVDGATKDGEKVLDWEDFCCFAKQYLEQAHSKTPRSDQAPNPKGSTNLLKDYQVESAEKSVESLYRDGWDCKRFMYCLKEDGLEIIRYDEPKGQSWTIATCQKKCEEYGEGCVMVDIHTWSGNYYRSYNKNQKSCVLYTSANALNWDKWVPEPETYGCRADKRAMACMHNSMNGKHSLKDPIKEQFSVFDTNSDNVIDLKELGAGMRKYFSLEPTEDELRDMMNEFDKDGATKDGEKVLDFPSFTTMWHHFHPGTEEGSSMGVPVLI